MPALEMAQDRGTLIRWLKEAGEFVEKGEPLMEIETDKADIEIEAPASGTLSDVSAQPGDEVPVGRVIARIVPASESRQDPAAEIHRAPDATQRNQPNFLHSDRAVPSRRTPIPVKRYRPISRLPPRRRSGLAAEANLDLSRVSGSGPRGSILASDIWPSQTRSAAGDYSVVRYRRHASCHRRTAAGQPSESAAHQFDFLGRYG